MGDSACLLQPFSYTAGILNEAMEGNSGDVLGQSISFGKFMSDQSIAWEKWSTFSRKNYVEEAQRYARPGSVAQKKAFFEAHYKTLAARKALLELEQANARGSQADEEITSSSSKTAALGLVETGSVYEHNVVLENNMKNECCEKSEADQMKKSLLKSAKVTASPAKFKATIRPNQGSNLTPMAKKSAMDISDRKRPAPKSAHKSINFTPAKELSKLTSTITRKIDGSRIASNSKASKECPTPLKTPNSASINGRPKPSSATPWSENRSARTPFKSSGSVSKTSHGKWKFLPTEKKLQSPGIFASFSLRTEERAARRKQRLEEKFNVSQEQKVEQQTTLKAETELKKLRQGFCFKARPMPDFYKERRTMKDQMEKVPLTRVESTAPGPGRKSTPSKASIGQSKKSFPHQKSSVKNQNSVGSLASRVAMAADENASPNIQQQQG
ncbi:hypothetical protein HRI_000378100 [Hibiscus trionum]|uniref:TPX2 C-terminal domain-containing protein n=1 Tax=Hibiscus trionum TaxID=183268 RepID=A0A9W7GYQ2_HIBTR|nr:hypothetical protein HRI_000378100 [Hibiscus trionum]